MRFSNKKRRHPPAVIIVSLIDILIVLLIFMMVTTTFKDTPALRITLPEVQKTDAKPGVKETPPILVTITTNNPHLYLGKTPISFDALEKELASRVKANPNVALAIRADSEAAYGHVVRVTEIASVCHVKQIKAFVRPAMKP